ncbi:MAG: folylpolyglutamate synthase/dihydrofolate synthase family protein [Gallionella sp.]|nr:folylpolyglutamate synthase/dihydrofolate synthase family protein [Gallionella sp.]
MTKTLADWLTYLESLHPKTIALGLERVAQVKQRLNLDPDFPIITVGGTNGKGSVCAMLESMLHAAGYRVGCYTSPHLLHYNERVRIAKQQASDAELCASFEKIEQVRKGQGANDDTPIPTPTLPLKGRRQSSAPIGIPLTYFEFGTLAAMQCFIEHKVDVAILEVGLGGRLDAVNAFNSDCAVVTSVDIDHTDYLGETREQIAFEKAGIFRSGKVAICADADVPQAIRSHAQQIGAELWCIGNEFGFQLPSPAGGGGSEGEGGGDGVHTITISQALSLTLKEQLAIRLGGQTTPAKSLVISRERDRGQNQRQWNYRSTIGTRNALPYPALRGAYQLSNASAALAALDAMKEKLPVSMEAVRRGLVEVQLAGRFQVIPGKPALILDVAHNPHAARSLAQNLASLPPCPHTWAVFAMLRDKDMAGVAAALDPHIDTWLVAGIAAPRGASADELAQVLRQRGVRGGIQAFHNVGEALRYACNAAGENDRIAAFGSFYTVAEVMAGKNLGVH